MRSAVRAVSALAVGIGSLAAAAGCRPVAAQAPDKVAGAQDGVPDNADNVAQEAVDARVTMMLYLDRLQGFRFSKRLVALGGWDDALAGTGVDPLTDVRRTFIAAHASHNGDVAIVLTHTADEGKVAAALAGLQQKWLAKHPVVKAKEAIELDDEEDANGEASREKEHHEPAGAGDGEQEGELHVSDIQRWIDEHEPPLPDLSRFPFPAAYRQMKNDFAHINGPVLIAEPHSGLIVVLPPRRAFAALRMMEAGGLPRPTDSEAMVFRAWEPDVSIQNGPAWSPDVRYAEAVFSFDGWGNSVLKFRAVCTSPQAAKAQAERMTNQVEDAQSVSIGGAKLRLFDYIEFRAENDRVKMSTRLLADDVDWLVAMSMKPL